MGNFDQYTVDDIREMVEADDLPRMREQAAAWNRFADLLDAQTPDMREVSAPDGWKGAASEAFNQHVAATIDVMTAAASSAAANGRAWGRIAARAEQARDEVVAVHEEWLRVRDAPGATPDRRYIPDGVVVVVGDSGDTATAREPFDREARAIMDGAVVDIEEWSGQIADGGAILPSDPSDPASGQFDMLPVGAIGADDGGDDAPQETTLQNTGWHPSSSGGMSTSVSAPSGSAPSLSSAVPQAMSTPAQQPTASSSGPGTRAPVPPPALWRSGGRGSRRVRRRTVATRQRVRLDNVGRPNLGTVNQHPTDEQPTQRPLERRETERLSSREGTSDTVAGVRTSNAARQDVHDPGPVFGRHDK